MSFIVNKSLSSIASVLRKLEIVESFHKANNPLASNLFYCTADSGSNFDFPVSEIVKDVTVRLLGDLFCQSRIDYLSRVEYTLADMSAIGVDKLALDFYALTKIHVSDVWGMLEKITDSISYLLVSSSAQFDLSFRGHGDSGNQLSLGAAMAASAENFVESDVPMPNDFVFGRYVQSGKVIVGPYEFFWAQQYARLNEIRSQGLSSAFLSNHPGRAKFVMWFEKVASSEPFYGTSSVDSIVPATEGFIDVSIPESGVYAEGFSLAPLGGSEFPASFGWGDKGGWKMDSCTEAVDLLNFYGGE